MLKPLEYLYFLAAIVEIYAEATQNETARFFAKPMLMVLLLVFLIEAVAGNWNRLYKFLAASLFFSWIGDVALMYVPKDVFDNTLMGIHKNPNYFLVGLAAFLVAHMLYAIAFANVIDKTKTPLLRKNLAIALPLVAYMAVLLYLLVPAISSNPLTKPFLVPVIIYSTAIATMVMFALNRFGRVPDSSFAVVFGGALLFMFSDSIIAINKFMHPFASAGIFIMALYIMGQYFIVKGCLAQYGKDR